MRPITREAGMTDATSRDHCLFKRREKAVAAGLRRLVEFRERERSLQ
jgi:hypothetical protein